MEKWGIRCLINQCALQKQTTRAENIKSMRTMELDCLTTQLHHRENLKLNGFHTLLAGSNSDDKNALRSSDRAVDKMEDRN